MQLRFMVSFMKPTQTKPKRGERQLITVEMYLESFPHKVELFASEPSTCDGTLHLTYENRPFIYIP